MDASYLLKKSNKDQTMSKTEKLQQYFNFTQSDLQANRQGRITENQQAHVKGKVQRFNSRIIVVLVIMFVLGLGATFAVRMASASSGLTGSIPTAALGPVITIVILILFMVFRTNKKNDFSIKKTEGVVNFVWVERQIANQDNTGYKTEKSLQIRVGGVSFNITQKLMDIVNQGDNVRFYYTGGGDIVSAEFVEK